MSNDLFYEVQLVTNGMVENYPKTIWIKTIRIQHIRDLILASEQDNEIYGQTLTSVLDSLINFEKTGFIKSSDELSLIDRQKLVIWQRLNSKGDKYTIPYECPNCKEDFDNTFSIKDMDEIKLKNKVKTQVIKYFVNEDVSDFSIDNYHELILGLPTRKDYMRMKLKLDEYKKDVFKKLDNLLYVTEINDLESLKKRIKDDETKLFLEDLKKKIESKKVEEEKKEMQVVKKENKNEIESIENKVIYLKEKRLTNKEEIDKIVEKYSLKFEYDIDGKLETQDNLYFDTISEYALALGCCIKNDDIKDYVGVMLNLPFSIISQLEEYMKVCYHDIKNKVIYRCPKCRYKSEKEDLNFTADFFLR